MFRATAVLNRMKCASSIASSALSQRARPITTSALRFNEDAARKQDNDVEALFNAESNTRFDAQARRRSAVCINRIELLGGVADYPLERSARSGTNYLTFNMFTNVEYRKPDGSFDENVELHNVVVFGGLVPYVRKFIQRGTRVLVTGRLHYTGGGPQVAGSTATRTPRTAAIVADVVQIIAKPDLRGNQDSGESQK